jgi:hypothetical protein
MKAKVIMIIDGEEYTYGTYNFDTTEEKDRANAIAMNLRRDRDCQTYIEIVGE